MYARGSRTLRWLDEYAGIPLSLVVGLARPSRNLPREIQTIGILMLGVIGDTLLASAILPDLRRAFPRARIVAFIAHSNRDTVELLEEIDAVFVIPVTRPLTAIGILRRQPADLLIDIGQWARISALLAALSSARYTVGFKTMGQHRHYAFDAVVSHSGERHEIDNFRALLSPLGIDAVGAPPLRREVLDEARMLGPLNSVIIHPWAAGYKHNWREWRTERWVDFVRDILTDGYDIVITGGPSDFPRAKALASLIGRSSIEIATGTASLRQTAVLLARAAGVVSVNTGIMHLAALVNAPLVALHGPTNPKRWGPINPNAIILGPGPEEGGAFLNLGFEYPVSPPDCMDKISVAEVLHACRTVIEKSKSSKSKIESSS